MVIEGNRILLVVKESGDDVPEFIPGAHQVRGLTRASCYHCIHNGINKTGTGGDGLRCTVPIEVLQNAYMRFASSPETPDRLFPVECDIFESVALGKLRRLSGRPNAMFFKPQNGHTLEGAASLADLVASGDYKMLKATWIDTADGWRSFVAGSGLDSFLSIFVSVK